MTYLDEEGLPKPPLAGDETATLLGSLQRQRAIFAWKCGGLDAVGLRATVGASSMTLGGLLKHLALVEDEYFSRRLSGRELGAPWDAVDWDADPDWEWHSAAEETPKCPVLPDGDRRRRDDPHGIEASRDGGEPDAALSRRFLREIRSIEKEAEHRGRGDTAENG
jgi:hypothetical protein